MNPFRYAIMVFEGDKRLGWYTNDNDSGTTKTRIYATCWPSLVHVRNARDELASLNPSLRFEIRDFKTLAEVNPIKMDPMDNNLKNLMEALNG